MALNRIFSNPTPSSSFFCSGLLFPHFSRHCKSNFSSRIGFCKAMTGSDRTTPQENGPTPSSAIDFLTLCQRLKSTKRTGWVKREIKDPESIADHMYRMAAMALIAVDMPGIDRDRCVKMAIVHDIAEAIVGDITPCDGISKEEKSQRERDALHEMCQMLGGGSRAKEINELWNEYENNSSPEAKLVKDFDKLLLLSGVGVSKFSIDWRVFMFKSKSLVSAWTRGERGETGIAAGKLVVLVAFALEGEGAGCVGWDHVGCVACAGWIARHGGGWGQNWLRWGRLKAKTILRTANLTDWRGVCKWTGEELRRLGGGIATVRKLFIKCGQSFCACTGSWLGTPCWLAAHLWMCLLKTKYTLISKLLGITQLMRAWSLLYTSCKQMFLSSQSDGRLFSVVGTLGREGDIKQIFLLSSLFNS